MAIQFAKCISAAGASNSGIVLYRLFFWAKKSKITRDGHTWVVMPCERWCEDTALSRKAFGRAVAQLKQKNLIVSERHLHENKVRAFIRPSALAVSILKGELEQ